MESTLERELGLISCCINLAALDIISNTDGYRALIAQEVPGAVQYSRSRISTKSWTSNGRKNSPPLHLVGTEVPTLL